MADIDFVTDLTDGGFAIAIEDSPQAVSGNRALVNRFELTFLTKTKIFLEGDNYTVDNFGGNAEKFINKPHVLSDIQGIAAAITAAIDATVKSLKDDEVDKTPNTEKILGADLSSIDIVDGIVVARVEVRPIKAENFSALGFLMPITRM